MNSFLYALPYLFLGIFLAFNSIPLSAGELAQNKGLKQLQTICQFFSFFILIFFFCCRGYVYSDSIIYAERYENVPSLLSSKDEILKYLKNDGWERGFLVFYILCKTFGLNYLGYQFISSLIDLVLLNALFKKYIPKHRILAFFLFFCFYGLTMEINLQRNMKAILLFFYSIRFLENNEKVKFFLLNILGMFFHISALIYIFIGFFINKKFNDKLILLLFILGNFVYLLSIKWMSSILIKLAELLIGGRVAGLLKHYTLSDAYSASYGITIGWIERSVSFLLFFHFSKKCKSKIFFNIFFLYSFTFLYCSEMKVIVERVPYLFTMSYWVLYAQVYESMSKKNKPLLLVWIVFIGLLKLVPMNLNPLAMYDNFLIGNILSRTQRKEILLQYFNGGI